MGTALVSIMLNGRWGQGAGSGGGIHLAAPSSVCSKGFGRLMGPCGASLGVVQQAAAPSASPSPVSRISLRLTLEKVAPRYDPYIRISLSEERPAEMKTRPGGRVAGLDIGSGSLERSLAEHSSGCGAPESEDFLRGRMWLVRALLEGGIISGSLPRLAGAIPKPAASLAC